MKISREEAIKILKDTLYDEKTPTDYLEAVKMGREALENQKTGHWIPVSDGLPECETEVLITTIHKYLDGDIRTVITTAIYEDGTKLECDSIWRWEDIDWVGWDEEEDCGIIPEGWWEFRHYNPDEVYNNEIDDTVIAWMPLPQPYKAELKGENNE